MVQPAAGQPEAVVPLSGRIIWDENATVRVFTPFAGIVRKLLHEGTTIEYDRPIFAGDVLTAKSMLKSITTREGKSGVRTIFTLETAYYDKQGKRVCALLIKTSEGQ